MANIIYFDCFSGISGDMLIAALLNGGLDFQLFRKEMEKLNFSEFDLELKSVLKNHISASKFDVIDSEKKTYRHPADLYQIIDNSSFDENIKKRAKKIFRKIAEAEAKIHGVPVEKIHFHEIGAVDTIVDVVGALVGIKLLEIEKVYCSKLNVGSGFVKMAHGTYPVPAPATAELLKGAPLFSTDIKGELITPTGAAIIQEIVDYYGDMPEMEVEKIGYGAGTKDFDTPNVLRVFLGKKIGNDNYREDFVSVIEANIDDMDPQIYDFIFDRLFKAGALDVFLTNIMMKKNRPGIQLSVLGHNKDQEKLTRIIFEETSSIGLRIRQDKKIKLIREAKLIETEFGPVNCKVTKLDNNVINVKPEYEDCKKIAQKLNIPLKQVYRKIAQRKDENEL